MLIQCRQLRDSLAFIDHGKEHQIVAYELEFVTDRALETEFRESFAEIKLQWVRRYGYPHSIPSSKKMQKRALLSLLRGTNGRGEAV